MNDPNSISNEAIRCLLIDPRAALVLMRPGEVFEASVFNVSAEGMRRVIGPGDTPSEAVAALGEVVSRLARGRLAEGSVSCSGRLVLHFIDARRVVAGSRRNRVSMGISLDTVAITFSRDHPKADRSDLPE